MVNHTPNVKHSIRSDVDNVRMTLLYERITQALDEENISQAEFARRIKVERATVNDWCKGRTKEISGANLINAAKALKVSPSWLAGESGTMRQSKKSSIKETQSPAYTTQQHHLLDLFSRHSPAQQEKYLALLEATVPAGRRMEALDMKQQNEATDAPAKQQKTATKT